MSEMVLKPVTARTKKGSSKILSASAVILARRRWCGAEGGAVSPEASRGPTSAARGCAGGAWQGRHGGTPGLIRALRSFWQQAASVNRGPCEDRGSGGQDRRLSSPESCAVRAAAVENWEGNSAFERASASSGVAPMFRGCFDTFVSTVWRCRGRQPSLRLPLRHCERTHPRGRGDGGQRGMIRIEGHLGRA